MPSRPDLRELATSLRDAFGDMDRDTLLDILTFVLKEYVVEGPPPMLVHQAETLADLRGATFAQLITALQTRFDFPELAMFVVDGETVSVRVGGVMQPLVAGRQPIAADLPRPAAGVRVVETTLQQRPAPAPQQPQAAPPPTRGVSVRGRPSGEPAEPTQQPPAQPAPAQPAPPAAAGDKPADKPESGGDDASARFSLLELD